MEEKSYLSKVVLSEHLLDEEAELVRLRRGHLGRSMTNLRRSVLYEFESAVTVRNETDLFWYNAKVEDWFHRPVFQTVKKYIVVDGVRLAYRSGGVIDTRGTKGYHWDTVSHSMPDDDRIYDAVIGLARRAGLPMYPYSYRSSMWIRDLHGVIHDQPVKLEWLWYAYPLMRYLPVDVWDMWSDAMMSDSILLRRVMESSDLRRAAKRVFGRGATRAHMKFIGAHLAVPDQTFFNALELADLLKGLVPTDYLLKLQTDEKLTLRDARERRFVRKILAEIPSPRRRFNIVCDGHRWLRDASRTYELLERDGYHVDISDARDAEEIHDRLVREMNRLQQADRLARENREIDSERYAGYDGLVVGDMVIHAPKLAVDLINWGIEMDHCIGAYVEDAVNPKGGLYFAVTKNGKLYANVQVQNDQIQQMFGAHNRPLSKEEALAISEALHMSLGRFMQTYYVNRDALDDDDRF